MTLRLEDISWNGLFPVSPTALDLSRFAYLHTGRDILVTGAGGSIGAALSRAIHQQHPRTLVLLDSSEQNLYYIHRELSGAATTTTLDPVLGSVGDPTCLREIFARFHPQIVYHAAALKHVPLGEMNPFAVVETNVFGTRRLAEAACRFGAACLIMISTDKSVNPRSVMGASKRLAELILLGMGNGATRMTSIRLGNVLGSEGSVVPVFLEQIARGGPVTVTDPEVERYFLTVDETVHRILSAVADCPPEPAVAVPVLGNPVRIVDLARYLIARAAAKNTQVVFTGLRPGDKMQEQFVAPDETVLRETVLRKTADGLQWVKSPGLPALQLNDGLAVLEESVSARHLPSLLDTLTRLVPEYQPSQYLREQVSMETRFMKRTIAVVTTSRADYSHLYWPLHDLAHHPGVDLKLIVMGSHLAPEFGATVAEIERDGLPVAARIECLLSSDTDVGMAKTIGVATLSLADCLGQMRPDLLLLIADRYEMLAPASVALALRIPIAHIEGGEISEGAIDDAVRNALTKMAHVHFTSTVAARDRVIALGEEPWRVHRAGAPSIDHLRRDTLYSREHVEQKLHISLQRPTAVVAYHPVTLARETTREAGELFAALSEISAQLVFCYPNADAGSRELIDRTRQFMRQTPDSHVFVNLPALLYWSLLRHAHLMIGNSSSGIMETPSFALPTVNIGMRQQGRERARNILDAAPERSDILAKVAIAQSPQFRESLAGLQNPYGEGCASETIVSVLTTLPLGEPLLLKKSS